MALTVAAVPTGMKAGVLIRPRGVWIAPVRAVPSRACTSNVKPANTSASAREKQTGVAIGIEPIVRVDRVPIGLLHSVETGKCRDQHEESRSRQMEIRQKQIDRFEPIPVGDENRCF